MNGLQRAECIDPEGFEGLLEYGRTYFVRPMPCRMFQVMLTYGGRLVTCARTRFQVVAP